MGGETNKGKKREERVYAREENAARLDFANFSRLEQSPICMKFMLKIARRALYTIRKNVHKIF